VASWKELPYPFLSGECCGEFCQVFILPLPRIKISGGMNSVMKKLLLITLALGFAVPAQADTSSRKLGRAVANILYGVIEIPEQMVRKSETEGRKSGWSHGVVDGSRRALKRIGYGVFELVTFHCPTYHGTFKPPYTRCGADDRIEMNPRDGLSEFPPELGFETYFSHSRSQKW
jgi:putative exosortase-associated protein (TIGR04073 family)